jgi:AAA15 family ATPase/GTPase
MRLRTFKITAYRSCLNTTITPHPQLTTLIGINGVGKSNLLNAIVLLRKIIQRNRPVQLHQRRLGSQCGVSFELIHEGKVIRAKGLIYYDTDEKNQDEVLSSIIKWNFKDHLNNRKWFELPLGVFVKYIDLVTPSDIYRYFTNFDKPIPKKITPVLIHLLKYLSGINYYSASQFSDPSKCPVSIELDENSPIKKTSNQFGHEQFILDLYRMSISNKKTYKKYLNTVSASGLNLVQDIDFQTINMPSNTYEIKAGGKVKQIEKNRSVIVPCFIVDRNNLSPNQLSEGTLKTLAILFYTLTDDSKLLLIEEPEVCVHHGLLNSIMTIIKSQARKKQIIISTHSDYVLDLLTPENVILVRKEPGAGTIASLLTKSMSNDDFKGLKHYLMDTGTLGEYWKESGFDFGSI